MSSSSLHVNETGDTFAIVLLVVHAGRLHQSLSLRGRTLW